MNLITDHLDLWTSTVKAKSSAGRGGGKKRELYGIKKLRELIRTLAIKGLLVPQNPNDEPASELLKRIANQKKQLIKDKVIKKQKSLNEIDNEEININLPEGWIKSRIGELANFQKGYAFKSVDYLASGLMITKIKNLTDNHTQNSVYIDEEKASDYSQYLLNVNDIVMTTVGSWFSAPTSAVGRSFVINETFGNSLLNQNAVRLRFWDELVPMYLFTCINSRRFKQYLVQEAQGTANQASITQQSIKNFIICVPPKEEQHRIVAKVDELMELCDKLEQQTEDHIHTHETLVKTLLDTLTTASTPAQFQQAWQQIESNFHLLFTTESSIDHLKQTILQLAVMGKLVPQDPNDEPASLLLKRIATEKARFLKEKKIKKQSGLCQLEEYENLYNLPEAWSWSQLDDVVSLKHGYAFKSKYFKEDPCQHILITPGSFYESGGFRDRGSKTKYYEGEMNQEFVFESGDLMIPMTEQAAGLLGSPAFIPDNEFTYLHNQRIGKVITYSSFTSYRFLAIFFNSKFFRQELRRTATGMKVKHTSPKKVLQAPIPILPLAEQKRIVAKVEELMSLCDTLKTNITTSQTTQLTLTDSIVNQSL
ncbi:MAG: restriction endonuclease subunit S [Akkermansiaceae bacterium]